MQKRLILCLGGPLHGIEVEFSGLEFKPNESDVDNKYILERGVDPFNAPLENYIWNGDHSLFTNFISHRLRQI
ncbi:hypothetical protein [Acinetobacter bereziniae]|uniref:hypothetical protein n=1 Tax=Acinetobacter bereziniae TaxID=106648 RepID=UPI000EF74328|nr:hypothetical protein [Acinetobacter bereziniae]